jgi:hypothetical protein
MKLAVHWAPSVTVCTPGVTVAEAPAGAIATSASAAQQPKMSRFM